MQRLLNIILLFVILFVTQPLGARSRGFCPTHLEPETLHYRVMFKWGLINKKAGTASLSLAHDNESYFAQLTAKSEPWADRFYKVRDTLNGKMTYADFTPYFYEKIAHEGGESKHDVVRYDYSDPNRVVANCTRKVYKKGELHVDEVRQLESDSLAVDMLMSFYYMRTLPFDSWQSGHVSKVDIFSGKRKELLSIVYSGIENLEIDGAEYPTYHITFQFTSGGGKKTSDDMEAWISLDKRYPLRLEGKLPVGKVHCILER